MALPATAEQRPPSRLAPGLGLASLLLLGAAFLWAHHWGVLADTIVAAWLATTVAALTVSNRSLEPGPGRRAALIGFALAGVSVVALVAAGLAMAAGVDPGAACGGG